MAATDAHDLGDLTEEVELQQILSRLCKALTIRYGVNIANSFKNDVEEESYDVETLNEELAADDLDDCTFVDTLSEQYADLFADEDSKQELLDVLKDALNNQMPRSPNAKEIVKKDVSSIKWTLTKKQVEPTQKYLKEHLKSFVIASDKKDKSLIDVVAIGKKNGISQIAD